MQGILEVKEEIEYYDGQPLIFSFIENGELYLAYWGDRFLHGSVGDEDFYSCDTYMVCKITEQEVANLKNGLLPPHQILTQRLVQLVKIRWQKEKDPQISVTEPALSEILHMIPEKDVTL